MHQFCLAQYNNFWCTISLSHFHLTKTTNCERVKNSLIVQEHYLFSASHTKKCLFLFVLHTACMTFNSFLSACFSVLFFKASKLYTVSDKCHCLINFLLCIRYLLSYMLVLDTCDGKVKQYYTEVHLAPQYNSFYPNVVVSPYYD